MSHRLSIARPRHGLFAILAFVVLIQLPREASAASIVQAFITETFNAMFAAHEPLHEQLDEVVAAAATQLNSVAPTGSRVVQIAKIRAKAEKQLDALGKKMESRMTKMHKAALKQLKSLNGTQRDVDELYSRYAEMLDTVRTDVRRRKVTLGEMVDAAL